MVCFFFFKQKTAYEMRISDWSSDVCSSDLGAVRDINGLKELPNFVSFVRSYDPSHHFGAMATGARLNSTMVGINGPIRIGKAKIGRASCRERVCQYV